MKNQINIITFFNAAIFKTLVYFIITNLFIGGGLYFFHIEGQEKGLFAAIFEKTKTIGTSIENLIDKALDAGIPLKDIKGLPQYLDRKLMETLEVKYIIITDVAGDIVAQTTDAPDNLATTLKRFALDFDPKSKDIDPFYIFSSYNIPLPITVMEKNNAYEGIIHIGVSTKAVQNKISDIFFDIAIILFVSLVIGFEFLRFTFRNHVIVPMIDLLTSISRVINGDFLYVSALRAKNQSYACLEKLNDLVVENSKKISSIFFLTQNIDKKNSFYDLLQEYVLEIKTRTKIQKDGIPKLAALVPDIESVRIIIFLVMICEGMMNTILPGYTASFWTLSSSFSKQFISASPVLVFMATVMFVVPFGPSILSKYGFKKAINLGLILYSLGFCALTFLEKSLFLILCARFFNALGFGLFYILIQNYIITYSLEGEKVKSYMIFSIATGAAYIVGMPIGGIIVDNIGFFYTFLLCVIVSVSAIFYSFYYIVDYVGFEQKGSATSLINPFKIGQISGIASVIILLGFPIRFLGTSLLNVFEPLFLDSLGSSMSLIGGVMMIFGVVMFCFAPVTNLFVGFFKKPITATFLCTLFMIISIICQFFFPTILGVTVSIAILSMVVIIHATSIVSILEKISRDIGDEHTRIIVMSIYFTYERMAMILGPLVTSFLIGDIGYSSTLLAFVVFLVFCNSLYYLVTFKKNHMLLKGD